MKNRQLELTSLAKSELLDVYDYTCDRWGEAQAEKYITGIYRSFKMHLEDPYSFSRPENELASALGFRPEEVRSFLYEKHRCYFYNSEEAFRVLSVIHTARDKNMSYARIKKVNDEK